MIALEDKMSGPDHRRGKHTTKKRRKETCHGKKRSARQVACQKELGGVSQFSKKNAIKRTPQGTAYEEMGANSVQKKPNSDDWQGVKRRKRLEG